MRKLACATVLALAVLGLGAEEPTLYRAGEIEIEAEAYSPAALAPAGTVAVVTAEDIERSGAANAADALEGVPGVWVNRTGPGGAVASASLRGATSAQVLLVVDGVRRNDARQGGADLSLIPASSIERIEVLAGGASAVYGSDALGGVVVITTKKAKPGKLAISFENDSYPTALGAGGAAELADGQRLSLDAGFALGAAEISVAAEGARASGSYPYTDSSGELALRENADFLSGSGSLSATAPLLGGRGKASFSGSYRDAGTPGSLAYPSPGDAQNDSGLCSSLGWSNDALADGLVALDLLASGSWTRLEAEGSYPSTSDLASLGFESRGKAALAPWIDLGFGASVAYQAADSTAFEGSAAGQPERLGLGAYLEPELRIGEDFAVTPALRFDWNDNFAAGLSAMLNAVYRSGERLSLRLSGGRSYRAPTFIELYWPYTDYGWGFSYEGNPDLEPETAWSAELGADFAAEGGFSASASLHGRWVENLIVSTSDAASRPVNLSEALVPGAELRIAYARGRLSAKASYEFAYPLDLSGSYTLSDNVVLEAISRHKVAAQADLKLGAASVGVAGRYWSDRVLSYEGATDGALVVDLRAFFEPAKGTVIGFAVENLLDADYSVNGSNFPMPGLTVRTSLRVEL